MWKEKETQQTKPNEHNTHPSKQNNTTASMKSLPGYKNERL